MLLEELEKKGFDIKFVSHAAAILEKDFPSALEELERVLLSVRVPIEEIIGSGGGESQGTQRLRRALNEVGWTKRKFEIKKTINGVERESISHEIDHVKDYGGNALALEIEWNNKDPFFDRDLDNFKRLHTEGAVSVGIIVTRGSSLHEHIGEFVLRFAQQQKLDTFEALDRVGLHPTLRQRRQIQLRVERRKNAVPFQMAWRDQFVSDKYGEATTHWRKLMDRISRGVGNPCPLLLIGLPDGIVRNLH